MINKLFAHVILVSFLVLNFLPISAIACSYTIFPERKNFTSTGGDQVVTINPSSGDCKWFTNEDLSWVEVSPFNGEGSDTVTIHVSPNIDSTTRKGSVNIAGHEFILTQLGVISSESNTGAYSKESMTSMSIITDSTKEDAEGNVYTVMGAAESITDFNVYADTGIDTEKIIGESEEKLTEYFTRLDFSDAANQNLRCDVEIKYDKIPTKIVAWNKESQQYYYLPFTSTYNTIKIRINTKDVSILPIYTILRESSAVSESTESYVKRFNIVENNGTILQIKTDLDYNNCKFYINGNEAEGCNDASNEFLFNGTVNESGIYTFILENSLTINIWEQDVFVQVNSDLDGIDIESLARKFAPVLAYNDNEEYFPMSLQYIFQNDIDENIPFEIPKEGSNDVSVPYSEVDFFMPYNGASTGLINNYDKDNSLQRTRLGNLENATVYYSMTKGMFYYYLNYHMLYTFDPKGGTSTEPATFAHVFDRESMTLVFTSKPQNDSTPLNIIYGAHIQDQNLALMSNATDQYNFWEGDAVSVSWTDVKKYQNTHPVIPVAIGSHALYPVCGTYGMTFNTEWTRETAGGSDEFSNEADWGRVLLPNQFLLEPLNLRNIKSVGDNAYLAFSGSWVDILGWTNAKFPPFTHREKDPDSWYADSFTWDVDYNALPQYSQDLMNSLENYLSFSWNLFLPAILAGASDNTVRTVASLTGRIWMDRNLGASRVAISPTDEEAYGDLYQWGRCTDGHEKRTSDITTILSFNDKPGHGYFITANTEPYDWRTPQNDNLWEGVNGTNNPCPDGFRIPTYDEWQQERSIWISDDISGAFSSPLKLVLAGYRNYDSGFLVYNESCKGGYWATDKNYYGLVYNLIFCYSSGTAKWTALNRAYGFSVRCIKDEETLQCGGPQQLAGGDTPETHSYNMGANSGSFQFDYDTYSIKDRIIIKHDNLQIFDTGCVGESRTVTIDFSGSSSVISVEVIPNCAGSSGTDWTYTVHCPN